MSGNSASLQERQIKNPSFTLLCWQTRQGMIGDARPELVRQGSIVSKALTGAVRLSEDNWKEVLRFLSLGDQLRTTTACCGLVLIGRAFFGQQRSTPLRFTPAAYLDLGVVTLGGAGRFGALRYMDLGQIGLASLTPPILAMLTGSASLVAVTVTMELKDIEEVSASDQLARDFPKLRIQATLNLYGACPTPSFPRPHLVLVLRRSRLASCRRHRRCRRRLSTRGWRRR